MNVQQMKDAIATNREQIKTGSKSLQNGRTQKQYRAWKRKDTIALILKLQSAVNK